MSNDSKSGQAVTPAPHGAPPRHDEGVLIEAREKGGETVPNSPALGAPPRHVARLHLYREGGIEYIVVNGERFVRDIDLGRAMAFSRPRDIRKLIGRAIDEGALASGDFFSVTDDAAGTTTYLHQRAATSLAVRSGAAKKEEVLMQLIVFYGRGDMDRRDGLTIKEALLGYNRTLAFVAKKTTPDPARRAAVPALEKYARAAGLPLPDLADLMPASPQPRLPGV